MARKYKVEWLGTPFAGRLTEKFWIAGCIKTRDPGAPSYIEELVIDWAESGVAPKPSDPVLQALLEASIHGGIILLYEYNGQLAPISRRLTSKPIGFGGPDRRKVMETVKDVIEGWARLVLFDDLDWLNGVPLDYPGGYSLTTKTSLELEAPCVYVEAASSGP